MNKKIILSLSLLAIVGITYTGIKYYYNDSNNYEKINKLNNENSETIAENKNILFEVISDLDTIYDNSNVSELEARSDLIIIGKIKEIDGAINYNETKKQYIKTSTIGTIKVKNIIKNNDIVSKNDEIKFVRLGGTISVAEYEKSLEPRQIVRQGLDKLTSKEKENSYIKVSISGDIEPEKNKTYLMYLKYDEDLNRYAIIGMEYGLKEYRESTKQVKNNKNKQWENINYNI